MSEQKKYKSLGEMIKNGDYVSLLEKLKVMNEKEFKSITITSEENPISQLDSLIFFIPDYVYKKTPEGVNTSEKYSGLFEFFKWSIEKGANPDSSIKYGVSCFLKSCSLPDSELVEFIIENNSFTNLKQQDGRGKDGLMYSVENNSESVFDFLINTNEFDINKKYIFLNNKTILHSACVTANEPMIDKIISIGGDLTVIDDYENTPCEMIPTETEHHLDAQDLTAEKIIQWEDLYKRLSDKTIEQKEAKKTKKVYKTSF